MHGRRFVRVAFALLGFSTLVARGDAPNEPKSSPSGDQIVELIRREAEANRKRREAEFERLHAPPVAAPPMLLNGQLLSVPGEEAAIGETDDGAPPPPKRTMINEDTFDSLVFANTGDAQGARNRLDFVLKARIDNIHRILTLSPAQREKLQLAGRGDIHGLFDRIERKRREFHQIRHDFANFRVFHPQIQQLSIEIWSGPFGAGSLSAKVLDSIRDESSTKARGGG